MIYLDSRGTETDEVLTIRKNLDTNEYVVRYTDPNNGSPVVHLLTGLYHQKVLDHVYFVMKNQYLDEEGFDQFQVNLPGMPRMLVSGEKFKDVYYRDHFYELLGYGLESLETATHVCKQRVPNAPRKPTRVACAEAWQNYPEDNEVRDPRPRHLFFDEE